MIHCRLTLVLITCLSAVHAAEQATSVSEKTIEPGLLKKAKAAVARLSSDEFDEREGALLDLKALDVAILHWLRERLEFEKKSKNLEAQNGLTAAIKALVQKRGRLLLKTGTPVRLSATQATVKQVLELLSKQVSGTPLPDYETHLATEKKADFEYEGPYWGAIEKILQTYPARKPEKWTREALGHRSAKWSDQDYQATGMSKAHAGVLRIRVGRMALETGAQGPALSMILVPVVEPGYEVDKLALNVEALVLDDGQELKPEPYQEPPNDRHRFFSQAMMMRQGYTMNPSTQFCSLAPARTLADHHRSLRARGTAEVTLRVSRVVTLQLKGLDKPRDLVEGVTVCAEPSGDQIKIKLAGSTNKMHKYYYKGKVIQFLDKDGKQVQADSRGTSSRSSNNSWGCDIDFAITGKPTQVRIRTPGRSQEVSLPFTLENMPLPRRLGEAPDKSQTDKKKE